MDQGNSKVWQATLTPHRSLDRNGFYLLMGLVVLVNLVVAGVFVALGAWPIAGFAGLDVLLVWWAFRMNFADARKLERISITEHELLLERESDRHPPQQRRFVRRWVRVELEEDRERELIGRLLLVSGRTRVAVGEFLPPEERKTLAQALKSALAVPRI
ncbi:MAG: DUF2244 domain-containing protein [Aestuariivirga sp.]|uniref:DUF2244 domain-containing protein n=1 Tax=Aestuariivirga sp. TaxID=2650926 RepID=UPI0025C40C6F|nr:DUF2244 domain-containing protein [Aestuariivirga sp.]MCA3562186.1 DUF2244 domain-containing protein [Aestuariivirga sp.]